MRDDIVKPCPLNSVKKLHWIEIELIGEDDQPVPWERYEVTLPDGTIASGFLDRTGKARVEQVAAAGNCQVTFPDLDAAAWDWYAAR